MVLLGEHKGKADAPEVVAVGRLSMLHRRDEAELAVLIYDRFQPLGIGTKLFRRLIAVPRNENLRRLHSTILAESREMRAICRKLGSACTRM